MRLVASHGSPPCCPVSREPNGRGSPCCPARWPRRWGAWTRGPLRCKHGHGCPCPLPRRLRDTVTGRLHPAASSAHVSLVLIPGLSPGRSLLGQSHPDLPCAGRAAPPKGRGRPGLLRSPEPFAGRGRCLCCSPGPTLGSKGGCWIPPTAGPLTFCLRPVNPRWPVPRYDDSGAEFVCLHLPT